jgi:hypothetical protein
MTQWYSVCLPVQIGALRRFSRKRLCSAIVSAGRPAGVKKAADQIKRREGNSTKE